MRRLAGLLLAGATSFASAQPDLPATAAAASDPGAFLNRRYDFTAPAALVPAVRVPRIQGRIGKAQLGLVINTADPYSVAVGEYYAKVRKIGPEQVLRVQVPVRPVLTPDEFQALAAAIDKRFGPAIEALALAWTFPYAVNCNSLPGALALGYDGGLCANSCHPSAHSRYFNHPTARPHTDLKLRPSMLIAARDVDTAKALVDRGAASDGTLGWRGGAPVMAFFLTTPDKARSVRAPLFPPSGLLRAAGVEVRTQNGETIGTAQRVLLYQTGLPVVRGLDTVHWVPGAVGDNLTSYGGVLDGSGGQTTVLDWIASGVTASYGTVSEPCARPQKFPHPQILLLNYLQGATALEAYWKSVEAPQQGLFVGDPLAAPFARR